MYYIHHIGFGPLTNQGEEAVITFNSETDAIQYLSNCGEAENIGTDWEIVPV